MKKHFSIFLFIIYCLLPICLYTQTWHQLSGFSPYMPGMGWVQCLKPINGKLYIGGGFGGGCPEDPFEGPGGNCIATFDGISWDSLGHGVAQGLVHSIEYYNGEVYVGGGFSYACTGMAWPNVNVPNSGKITKWNGAQWLSVDSVLSSYGYKVLSLQYKNDLYIGGDFVNIPANNGNAKSIVRYNGSTTDNMQGGVDYGMNEVRAMAVWNGDLYVAGGFYKAGSISCGNIAKWNGTQWSTVGSGVNGSIMSMVIDTNTNSLYVAGLFDSAGTVPVHSVAKWDGTNWSAVGIPPQWYYGFSAIGLFKNEIYVAGAALNNSPYDSLLIKWDGTKWSVLPGIVGGGIYAMQVYKGNFYIGGIFNIDTTTVNGIACYGDSCPGTPITLTLPYGVNELHSNKLKFKVYPNPAKNNITIETEENKIFIVRITNSIGQKVSEEKFQKKIEVDISSFRKGLFLVEVCDEKGIKCHTKKVLIE